MLRVTFFTLATVKTGHVRYGAVSVTPGLRLLIPSFSYSTVL